MKSAAGNWKRLWKKKKAVLLFGLAAGAGLISFGIYSVKGTPAKGSQRQEITFQETQAKIGSISNTIVGTGNLELAEGETVGIPSGLVVEEVKVEAGDQVSKGDVLAVLDQSSVLCAMENVQKEIEDLDEMIDESSGEEEVQSVKSKVEGRIKKIYVQQGEEISECMVEQGALMLISLDGYLAIDISTDTELAKGDAVNVIRSDGTSKEGTVETVSDGTVTVLCSDSGIGMGEEVTAADTQGNVLGTGSTYIHRQLAVTQATGVVEDICVSEDEKIYSGTTLFTVEEEQSLEYQEQIAERQELTETLQKLLVLSKSGTITAQTDGIVQSVNISAENSQSASQSGNLQISKNSVSVVASAPELSEERAEKALAFELASSGASDKNMLVLEIPETGKKPQKQIETEDGSYQGTISWKPEDEAFAPETSYQAKISLLAGEGYCFTEDSVRQIQSGVLAGVTVSEDGKLLDFQITYPATGAEDEKEEHNPEEDTKKEQNPQDDRDAEEELDRQEETENRADDKISQQQPANGAENKTETDERAASGIFNDAGAGNGSNLTADASKAIQSRTVATVDSGSAAGSSGSGESEEQEASGSSEVAAFTLAASDTMVLAVNVDELDINSVDLGQEAKITLDAIEGEEFSGTVTKIGSSVSSSAGVAKYTVKITIPKDQRMREGMNASAVVTIENKENVVTIPVNALQERGNRVFVYTESDGEGKLSGEREVTTGLSDGDTVEITEGLSEGDKIYYQKTGNLSQQGFGGMGAGFRDGMGEMPGGGPGGAMGEMPDGDFKQGNPNRGAFDRNE